MDTKKVVEMLMSNLESEVSVSQSPVMRCGTTLQFNLPLCGATPYIRQHGSVSMVVSFVPLWDSSTTSYTSVWNLSATFDITVRYVQDPFEELGHIWKELEDLEINKIREINRRGGGKWR